MAGQCMAGPLGSPNERRGNMEFGILFTSHPNPNEEPYPHRDVHARTTAEVIEAERDQETKPELVSPPDIERAGNTDAQLRPLLWPRGRLRREPSLQR